MPSLQASEGCPTRLSVTEDRTHEEYLDYLFQLPAADKYCLWKDKMNHSLQFFSNDNQKDFIIQSSNLLSVELFEQGNPAGFDDQYLIQARELFTMDQIARVFLVLHDFDNPPAPLAPNQSGGGSSDCTCYWSISCGVLGYCEPIGCTRVRKCGFFSNSDCVGRCENGGM